jgi:hypothetical protein
MNPPLDLGLVIDSVKTNNALKENVKFWVAPWIPRHFEQRSEHIYIERLMSYRHISADKKNY